MGNSSAAVGRSSGRSGTEQKKKPLRKFNQVVDTVFQVLYHMRKVVMAAPVVYYALKLAIYNSNHLPPLVGLDLQASGEFAQTIGRQLAVMGPLALTGGCLVMMFLSRKAVYPWVISIFSLSLPILLLVSNLYPN